MNYLPGNDYPLVFLVYADEGIAFMDGLIVLITCATQF